MLIGYARVSSNDQNLDLQIDLLKQTGCEKIFSDKISGINKNKSGLLEAISHLRSSDTLVVWKLDRLGRSLKNLIELIGNLEEKKIHFQSITDGINTTTPAGKFFFHVMASLAQMERELLIERTKAGLDAAKKRGRVGGRKRIMTPSKIEAAKKLLSEGMPPKEVSKNLGISIPTLYRWCPAS
ncbi:MAG: recombinase family protein [Desulfobacterales bacterium]|nr:recombinase family protein [Desulfobacterales bacterium]